VEKALEVLWDNQTGAFYAATKDCRQIDIWGNAYLLYIRFPLSDARRVRVRQFLRSRLGDYAWHGQIRHLLKGEYWQRLLAPIPRDRYQNGAYWATAAGWVMAALHPAVPEQAHALFVELIRDFQAGDICECVGPGYRQLPSYVVSATNPYGVARRLFGPQRHKR